LVQEGHFQIDSVGRDDDDEKGNIGILGIVPVLAFVCCSTVGVILTFDCVVVEGTTNLVGTKASSRHFSGFFLAYSSCARANLGHENGVILPSTLGLVISITGTGGWIFSIVIELFVWIGESVWLDDCIFSVVGTDKASFRISSGGNVRWVFLLGSPIEISHWIPHSFSGTFVRFGVGVVVVVVDLCSSIVDIDNGSLSSVRFSRIQSCKVRRRSLSIYGKRRELIDA
jgi:hypothetical protein